MSGWLWREMWGSHPCGTQVPSCSVVGSLLFCGLLVAGLEQHWHHWLCWKRSTGASSISKPPLLGPSVCGPHSPQLELGWLWEKRVSKTCPCAPWNGEAPG